MVFLFGIITLGGMIRFFGIGHFLMYLMMLMRKIAATLKTGCQEKNANIYYYLLFYQYVRPQIVHQVWGCS